MKKESRTLLDKSIHSVLLAVEHFNRFSDIGRHEAILIFLDRGFELLLKSTILHKGGIIRGDKENQTIGFNSCVRKCVSDENVKCISESEAFTIQIINSLRDAAQHHILEVSEQQLYIYTQSGITLYDKLLFEVFGTKITDYMPDRVLPISPNPPKEFGALMDVEFEQIREMAVAGKRRSLDVKSKLLSFAIIEESLQGNNTQPTEKQLENLVKKVKSGNDWTTIFPALKQLTICQEGRGFLISLRITKNEGNPVFIVPEGTPGATPMAIKRVNELDFYSLSSGKLAEKLGITTPKLGAIAKELKIKDDTDMFKEIKVGESKFNRYSALALDKLKKELPNLDIGDIWERNKPKRKKSKGQ
jgi:hypothetical protein